MTTTPRIFAYVGSRTTRERNARGEGISVFRVDPATGALTQTQLLRDLVNPSYLALNRAQDRLYCVHGDEHEVSAFSVDAQDGSLRHLQTQQCGGRNPVHLALDAAERYLVVSNHLNGTLAVLPLDDSGLIGPVTQLVKLDGQPGPHRIEQPFAKPHHNPFSRDGRFVVVPDKGLDRIFSFRFVEGRLTPAEPASVVAREGAGPRHIAFHPVAPFAYAVNELDSTVTTYRFDPASGGLSPLQILTTLCDTFTSNSRAAAILIDAEGRFVFVTNRGENTVTVFSVDAETGRLRRFASVPSGGRTPRHVCIGPDGEHCYVLNEDSDRITVFSGARSGALQAASSVATGSPVCMIFATFAPA